MKVKVPNGIHLFLLLAFAAALLTACGDPYISVNDRTTYERDMGELYSPGRNFLPMTYMLGPGDELEVLYHIDPGVEVDYYRIDTEDTLRIEFYYYPTMNTTVRVRPDGRITMPLVGEVEAAGLTPTELANVLTQKYTGEILRPNITVDLLDFNVKVDELKQAITTNDRGQSRLVYIRPDGGISLPYIGDIFVSGLTAQEASELLIQEYRKFVANLSVTVAVLTAHSNRAYIYGEVNAANFYELIGPTTVSQLVGMANGFTAEANTHQIVLVSRDEQGRPKADVLDMDDIIGRGDIGADAYVHQYDVVFVPRTALAQAALVMDRITRLIPTQFAFAYSLGGTAAE